MNLKRINSSTKPRLHSRDLLGQPLRKYFLTLNLVLAGMATACSALAEMNGSPNALGAVLETVQISGNGEAVTFKTGFDRGELFLLKATGAIQIGAETVDALRADGAADAGVDVGLKETRELKGVTPGRQKWFGEYRADHTYYMIVTGTGEPLTLKLGNHGTSAGQGSIAVSLFRLSPAPQLPQPLETILVPVLQQTEQTTLTTRSNTVYLLRCAGDAKVGGGGLGRGDAEYMDYKADGTGKVDVGDGNTDYGLGVDEADLSIAPRQHWWGPWRKDHTYFLLFAGTGQPIHFYFYDVKGGYGDNSRTERLTVDVLPVP